MLFRGSVLSTEEKKKIHEGSIEVLETVGIKFPSEKALSLLEKKGAIVDWDKQSAKISRSMVEEALKTTPKEFTLGARNSEFDFHMPSSHTTFTVDGTGVNFLDYGSKEKRNALLKDIVNTAKVYETIDMGQIYWPPAEPMDVVKGARYFAGVCHSFINTSKHIQGEVREEAEVVYTMKLLKELLGSDDEIRKRKLYSGSYCTVAPLTHDKEMLEANMLFTKYHAPILIYPMPACGTTGPATLYSDLIVANAEALSCIVIFQAATPGAPLIYGSALGSVNMKNGLFLEGAPETALLLAAMGEMGKYYNLPTIVAGCLTDAKLPGMQTVMEKCMTTIPQMLMGVDGIQGMGMFESSMTLSLEQLLIDGEIARLCKRLVDGIDVCDEKALIEDIQQVGQGGHYLTRKSSRKFLRTDEFFTKPTLIDRNSYGDWLKLGGMDMYEKAHEQVEEIIKEGPRNPLDRNMEKVVLEILEEAEQKL